MFTAAPTTLHPAPRPKRCACEDCAPAHSGVAHAATMGAVFVSWTHPTAKGPRRGIFVANEQQLTPETIRVRLEHEERMRAYSAGRAA